MEWTEGERTRRKTKKIEKISDFLHPWQSEWKKPGEKQSKVWFESPSTKKQSDRLKHLYFCFSPFFVMWWENKLSSPCTGQTQLEKRTHWHPMEPWRTAHFSCPSICPHWDPNWAKLPAAPCLGTPRNFSGFTKVAKRGWNVFSSNSAWHRNNYWLYLGVLLYFALKASLSWVRISLQHLTQQELLECLWLVDLCFLFLWFI